MGYGIDLYVNLMWGCFATAICWWIYGAVTRSVDILGGEKYSRLSH